jgi:hypothetical protein
VRLGAASRECALAAALAARARHGSPDAVRFLLTLDFDVSAAPVLEAALQFPAFPYFADLQRHPRFRPAPADVRAALPAAVRAGNPDALAQLLALAGADLGPCGGEPLLCCAVRFENAAALKTIAALPTFDAVEQRADEALALAIQSDFAPGVRSLAPLVGVNGLLPRMPPIAVDDRTALRQRMRPLAAAAFLHADSALAELLAMENVDVNVRTPDGAPVLFAVLADRSLLRALCRNPALDVNARDALGNTVLHRILAGPRQAGQGEVLRIVCERGADRALVNGAGQTAWQLATAGRGRALEPADVSAWIGLAVGAASTGGAEWDSVAFPARRHTAPARWDG